MKVDLEATLYLINDEDGFFIWLVKIALTNDEVKKSSPLPHHWRFILIHSKVTELKLSGNAKDEKHIS